MGNTESSSRATFAASASMKQKYIALRGGSVAARFSMSSNNRSLNQVNDTRLSNGRNAMRICSAQYCSTGEFPMTIAILVVSGSTCRMFFTTPAKSMVVVIVVSVQGDFETGN